MTPYELDDSSATRSLKGDVCPACGNAKARQQTLCLADYRRLPREMKSALYRRVGYGYRDAVVAALLHLGVRQCRMPEVPTHA